MELQKIVGLQKINIKFLEGLFDLFTNIYFFFKIAHLWDICRNTLIGVVSGLSLLLIIWFVAANKFPEGENFSTIIFYSLILVDFVLDMVVLRVHGRDLKWFYICRYLSSPLFSLYYNILIISFFPLHVYALYIVGYFY